MYNQEDWIWNQRKKDRIKIYHTYCDKCGIDRGYQKKSVSHKLCLSCTFKGIKKKPFTEEHKLNIKISKIKLFENGYVHPNKGKHLLQETKNKIGIANSIKMKQFWIINPEHYKDLPQLRGGRKAWNKGLTKEDPRVAKYIKNCSSSFFKKGQSLIDRFGEEKAKEVIENLIKRLKENNPNKNGLSLETRKKISLYQTGEDEFIQFRVPFIRRLRNSKEYVFWRYSVLKRDNYTCQECGCKENLEAHHKKRFSLILNQNNIKTIEDAINFKDLWDINNGITLCLDCHIKFDKYRKQFFEVQIKND